MEAPHWALEHGLLRAAFARRVASCVMLWAVAAAVLCYVWALLFGGSSVAEAVFFGGAAAVVVTAERVAASGAWACANALPLQLRLGMVRRQSRRHPAVSPTRVAGGGQRHPGFFDGPVRRRERRRCARRRDRRPHARAYSARLVLEDKAAMFPRC
jgi:hypothetical protein